MTADLSAAFLPVGIAVLCVAVPVLVGKAIHRGGVTVPASELPNWLADLDFPDDGADVKRSPACEAAQRQALALDEPDPAFIARTRALVMGEVDELASRRSVTS